MKVYLASKSPRRQELLKHIVEEFEIVVSDIDEVITDEFEVSTSVMSLSYQKAVHAVNQIGDIGEDYIVIAADTVVYADGVMTKPVDVDDAREKLHKLSDSSHVVYTGFSIISSDKTLKLTDYECTTVYFKKLSEQEIERYLLTDEPYDKAGAYAIQGKGSVFIEKIIGDYFNVVGLPLCKLNTALLKLGVFDEA